MSNPYDWSKSKNIDDYETGMIIRVNNLTQKNYEYVIERDCGDLSDHPEFQPYYTPQEMLMMGIFGGEGFIDCSSEYPIEWFIEGKMSTEYEPKINYFKLKNRTSLSDWLDETSVIEPDERGWFQWYCRFWLGRRMPEVDKVQINRWKEIKVYQDAIREYCPSDIECCVRERQLLLQWSYDCLV